jgi:hypothetical protein
MQRANIHTLRVADSTPEAGIEMMQRNLRQLWADFWTVQAQSPRALTCSSKLGILTVKMNRQLLGPTVILSTCEMLYQIEVPVLSKQNTI